MRTVGNVRKLVSSQMIFSLKSSIANVADKSTFDCVLDDVLLHQVALGQCHLTFGTAIKNCAIEGGFLANLARLK